MDRDIDLGTPETNGGPNMTDVSSAIAELRQAVEELTLVARDTQVRLAGMRDGVDRQLQPLSEVRAQIVDGLVSNAAALGDSIEDLKTLILTQRAAYEEALRAAVDEIARSAAPQTDEGLRDDVRALGDSLADAVRSIDARVTALAERPQPEPVWSVDE